jgi:peptide/nickel transport system substrate-binding protein
VKLLSQESLRVIYLGFDMARNQSPYVKVVPSPLKDRRVREAVYRAIDENKIIKEILHGYGRPASQFCSPYVFGFNPKIERLPYDPEGAKKLLREAGYPNGFSLTLHCPNNRYIKDEEIGKMVTEQLREVGIDAELQAMPKEEFLPLLSEKEFSFFLAGWDCPDGDASSVFFDCLHSSNDDGYGNYNAGGYANTQLDSIIEAVETTIDPIRRTQLFETAQAIGMSDIPWVPLHIQKNLYGIKKNLTFKPRHDNTISLTEATQEGLL